MLWWSGREGGGEQLILYIHIKSKKKKKKNHVSPFTPECRRHEGGEEARQHHPFLQGGLQLLRVRPGQEGPE